MEILFFLQKYSCHLNSIFKLLFLAFFLSLSLFDFSPKSRFCRSNILLIEVLILKIGFKCKKCKPCCFSTFYIEYFEASVCLGIILNKLIKDTFNLINVIYEQIDGAIMVSPLFPVLATVTMTELETKFCHSKIN